MAVNLVAPDSEHIFSVPGVKLGVAQAGIRKANRDDLTIIELVQGSLVAGVFTSNRYCAAPVQICRKHLAATQQIKALFINTGNANAGTGEKGYQAAMQSCERLATLM